MPAIFFALISYIGWGSGDIFGVIATRKLGAYSITFWSFLISLVVFSLYAPFVLSNLASLTFETLVLNVALGIVFLAGFIAFNKSMMIGNPSIVGTITASFSSVAVVLSLLFLNEHLTPLQAGAIVFIFLGVILSSFHIHGVVRGKALLGKGVIPAIVAMICFGVSASFIKLPIAQIGWFWPMYIIYITLCSTLFIIIRVRKIKIFKPTHKSALLPLIIAIILLRIGELSYNVAVSKGLVAVVAPIAGSYITLFVPLAFFVFREPITKQQIGGIIITVIGIVLLSVVSV